MSSHRQRLVSSVRASAFKHSGSRLRSSSWRCAGTCVYGLTYREVEEVLAELEIRDRRPLLERLVRSVSVAGFGSLFRLVLGDRFSHA
jgi:hypothetical protein